MKKIFLLVIIFLVVIVIFLNKDTPFISLKNKKKEFRSKSISEYYSLPESLGISEQELNKTGTEEIIYLFSGKLKEKNYYEITMLTFYGDKNWQDGNEHVMYVEVLNDDGVVFYGPINDNPSRLIQELNKFTKENYITSDQEFLRYEIVNNSVN